MISLMLWKSTRILPNKQKVVFSFTLFSNLIMLVLRSWLGQYEYIYQRQIKNIGTVMFGVHCQPYRI